MCCGVFPRQRTTPLPNSCLGTGNRRKPNPVGRPFFPAFDRGISYFRQLGNHGVGRTLTVKRPHDAVIFARWKPSAFLTERPTSEKAMDGFSQGQLDRPAQHTGLNDEAGYLCLAILELCSRRSRPLMLSTRLPPAALARNSHHRRTVDATLSLCLFKPEFRKSPRRKHQLNENLVQHDGK